MAATMRDVAREARVSPMTVSNVLNDRDSVDEGRRQRVLEAVAKLDYQMNLSARHLRSGSTGTVAAIVPSFDHLYFGSLSAALTKSLLTQGLHTVVEQSGSTKDGELYALSGARMLRYDGLILSAVGLSYDDINALQFNLPIVLLGEQTVPKRFDHIMMDNIRGGYLATEHLLSTGAERVAIVGGRLGPIAAGMSEGRTQGWIEAHRAAGLAHDPSLIISLEDYDAREAHETIGELLRANPDVGGLFCVTDFAAIGALTAIQEAGYRCPQDIQVVGFDNLVISKDLSPALTTVDPGMNWIVAEATRLLVARMAPGGKERTPEHLVSPVRLIARGTTRNPATT